MCGFVGYFQPEITIQLNDFKKGFDLINHRGPDGDGLYHDNDITLGHKRLAIIDLAAHSNQPFFLDEYVLVFNGEIYNFADIKAELIKLGHKFVTDGDSEVILHSYKEWKDRCTEKFRGMWAFAIYNKTTKELFLSRDHFGIKPLYYHFDGNAFIFSSEIKPIIALSKQKILPDQQTISEYLILGTSEPQARTFFKQIKKLSPGHNATIRKENFQLNISKYHYDLIQKNESDPKDYLSILNETIKYHLIADVTVGTCLSGGLDSSLIASVASEAINKDKKKKLIGITATVIDKDESSYAIDVAKKSNIDHHIITPSLDEITENLDDCLYSQEEPVGSLSIIMQYLVIKKAKDLKIKVLLDGQGGDECLLGYERYYAFYLIELLKNFQFIKFVKSINEISNNSKLTILNLLKYWFYFPFRINRLINSRLRFPFLKSSIVDTAVHSQYLKLPWDLKKLQSHEICHEQLPHLLRYEDKNSMRHSIEARVPFVDKIYTRYCVNLPYQAKIENGYTKYISRQTSGQYLSEEIRWRKIKFGFESPEHTWMSQNKQLIYKTIEESELIQAMLKNNTNKNKFYLSLKPRVLWRFYNLAIWERQYFFMNDKNQLSARI